MLLWHFLCFENLKTSSSNIDSSDLSTHCQNKLKPVNHMLWPRENIPYKKKLETFFESKSKESIQPNNSQHADCLPCEGLFLFRKQISATPFSRKTCDHLALSIGCFSANVWRVAKCNGSSGCWRLSRKWNAMEELMLVVLALFLVSGSMESICLRAGAYLESVICYAFCHGFGSYLLIYYDLEQVFNYITSILSFYCCCCWCS